MIPIAVTDMEMAALAAAAIVGFLAHVVLSFLRRRSADRTATGIVNQAKAEAERVRNELEAAARGSAAKLKEEAENEARQLRQELAEKERRLDKREDQIERKQGLLDKTQEDVRRMEQQMAEGRQRLEEQRKKVAQILETEIASLERISGLNKDAAREMLLEKVQKTMDGEIGELISKRVTAAKEEADQNAREIVVTTIQRMAAEHMSENVVSSVDLPSDDMKGRIIGREGRNIRSFEKATGVDVIVDDTPGVVIVSGFDPIRRELARRAMVKLVSDGRIHPARIEEIVAKTGEEMNQIIDEAGRSACMELGLHDLHPKIQELLGRLKFRTSYGQNILSHSVEVAYVMSVMAAELGLDPQIAKRCGLLHDIGKAIDHEVEGGHPEIGAEFAKRHGEDDIVVNAIAAHHQGCEAKSLYPALVAAADALSAARPGARRETLERYIKRLERLEEVARSFEGIEQTYAIQAGREVRVIVKADQVSDEKMTVLGRDIANAIEAELRYPGEIKVTLIRETRVVEYAR
jgi:ribonuclease Y